MNCGEIAENAVGNFCSFWVSKALRILLGEARRIRSKEGGVAPASLPLFESGTSRILSE